jgi:ribosomal protein S18 acetylase RimI-like enzyme
MSMIEVKQISLGEDLAVIVEAIKRASWSDSSEIETLDYIVEKLKACIQQESHIFCVAYLRGQFAGMASAFVLQRPDGDMWLYVDEVDVCADMQRQGVGTAMMQFLFAEANKQQCREVWLGTEQDNVAANKLYSSLQPTETEAFVGYTFKTSFIKG